MLGGARPPTRAFAARVGVPRPRARARRRRRARRGRHREQRTDGIGARIVGVGLRGAGAGGVARGRAPALAGASCRSWRASARARRRARSSADSSRWRRGERADGRDAVAAPARAAPTTGRRAPGGRGHRGGREGRGLDRAPWIARRARRPLRRLGRVVPADLAEARAAIAARDLARLGAVAERSALRMHATALAADPAIVYWNGATRRRDPRDARVARTRHRRPTSPSTPVRTSRCCAPPADADDVAAALATVPGVLRTIIASPGPGARLVDTHLFEPHERGAQALDAQARSAP